MDNGNAEVALMFCDAMARRASHGFDIRSVEHDSLATCTLGVLEPKPIRQKEPSLLLIGEPRA